MMARLRDYSMRGEPGPSLEIDITGGGGAYLPRPETVTDEEGVQIEQLMRGKPPLGFGDEPWREKMAGLEEESTAIRGETEEILGRIKERYTPEQISAAKERLAGRRRPPEGYRVPEFSNVGRERYEQGIFREIEESHGIPGGNPFKIDPTEAVDQAMATQWPKRFEQITNLPFAYADELEGQDLKLVNAERLRFKAEVFAKAERKLKYAKDYHTYAMSKYDTQRKAYEGKLEQERKEALKPPETEVRYNEVTEQNEIWEWKPEFGKWVNTERVKKEKPKEKKPEADELKKSQMLDDWRSDYTTRLNQLKDDYGDFNAMTGLWVPNRDTYDKYKKKRDKLINEYEKGTRSILEGKVPKRMAGTMVGARQEEDYVGKFIQDLTKGY